MEIAIIITIVILIVVLLSYGLWTLLGHKNKPKKTKNNPVSQSFLATAPSAALPTQVIFIRHSEKPDSGPDLNAMGYAHAKCWTQYFTAHRPAGVNEPQALYAMSQHSAKSSNRPMETISGLGTALGLKVNDDYRKDDYNGLVQDILQNCANKTVLVCWEHDAIPGIVDDLFSALNDSSHLKVRSWGLFPAAKKNDGSDFSTVWVVNFSGSSPQLQVLKGCSVNQDGSCVFY